MRKDRLPPARDEGEGDGSWTVSLADLMSLLLVVFVMMAAMGGMDDETRFGRVGSAVRAAFGFEPVTGEAVADGEAAPDIRAQLLERFASAGLAIESDGLQDEAEQGGALAACTLKTGSDWLAIHVAGGSLFEPHHARVRPEGKQLLARLAAFLADGRCRLEVRGFDGDGPLPRGTVFRDGLDLSYARARQAADVLVGAGVKRDRLTLMAMGDRRPLTRVAGGDRRGVEIIIRDVEDDRAASRALASGVEYALHSHRQEEVVGDRAPAQGL